MSPILAFLRRACVVVALAVVVVVVAVPADAQSCSSAHPWYYDPTFTCDRSGPSGVCRLSAPVTFSAVAWTSWSPLSCANVDWNFGDSSPIASVPATAQVQHTYAEAGTYRVIATFRVGSASYVRSFDISVANGVLQWFVQPVEEGDTASVVVTRTNVTGATSMTWQLRRPDGTVPTDVTPTSGTVTLADGAAVARIALTTVEDSTFGPARAYTLKAGPVTGGFLPPADTTLHISDDDYSILDFATPVQEVMEQDGVLPITVRRLSGDPNVAVGVSYHVYGTTGVVATSGTLTFGPGELSRTFNVVLTNDSVWTGRRQTSMEISFPTGGARFPNGSHWRPGSIAVLEDDPQPTLSVSNVSVVEGNSGNTRGSFVATSSAPIFGQAFFRLVGVTASAGEDFTVASGWLTFDPTRRSITVDFTVRGDTIPEEDETLRIEFTSWTGFQKPQPALITILNDDAGVGPSRLRVLAGGTGHAFVDIGSAATAPVVVGLSSSDATAASVPASVTIPIGEKKAQIPITGVTAHRAAEITVQLPAAYSDARFVVRVDVDGSARLAFEPSQVKGVAGQRVPLQIRMDPAPPNSIELPLEVLDAKVVKAPATVTIAADGTGSFEIEALKTGFTVVRATLPDTYGGQSAVLDVEVVATADKPSLLSLSPATGPAAGGTQFVALGSRLSADCTLSFGGAPAANLTLGSDGTLTGLTPAHPAGTVDVALVCGTSRSKLARAFTYVSTPPTLTSIAPTFGSTGGGTLVRATGAHFQSGCWLFFGEQAARAVAVDSTTSLVATAPASDKAGLVAASVRCGNAGAFLASAFAYTSAAEPSPSILSVSPLFGAPGESVTVTGARFRTSDRVDFDRTAATLLRTRPDEQVVRIPELPLGLAAITLTDAEGRVTTTGPIFTVVEPTAPQVTKVTPSAALPGSEIVLDGRGFRPGYSFAVGGRPATTVSLEYNRAVVRLAAATAPGEYPVHVLNAAGKVAAVGAPVRIGNGALRVTNVAPSCGTTDGGAALVITGDGFAEGAVVTLNGVSASDIVLVSATELRATAPPGADGPAVLVVTNADGTEARLTGAFRYSSPFDPQGCVTRVRSVRH